MVMDYHACVCVLILGTVGFIHDHIYLMLTKSSCGVELERDKSESQRHYY